VILKAKGFGDWIEARKGHRGGKFNVGDVLVMSTTHAQQYDQNGTPKGDVLKTQAQADAVPRNTTLGFYGTLALAPGQEAAWIEAAEAAYREDENAERQRKAISLADPDPSGYHDEFANPDELGI
jgi:hypothetical protein